jgi:phosphate-selective porin OprO/OprP
MRRHRWWRLIAISAALVIGGTTGPAYAQAPPQDPPPVEARQLSSRADENARLYDRLERMERELEQLRNPARSNNGIEAPAPADVSGDSADNPPYRNLDTRLRALETNLNTTKAADTAAAAADADGKSPLKKVDTISKPTAALFGRVLFDQIMYDDPPALAGIIDRQNEFGFSTIRIGVKGNAWENVLYQVEVEFEGSETDFKDCFLETTNCPILGNVRVGHFKEPFSLEETTSSRFITFMSRSNAHGALVPSRNYGVMAYDYLMEDQDWTWMMGTFRNSSPDNPVGRASFVEDRGDWTYDVRIAGNPYYDEPSNGRYLVHVGSAYSYRRTSGTNAVFTDKPELGSQNGYLGTQFTGDRDWNLFGGEAALAWGPSSLQSEVYAAYLGGDQITGGYVQYSYFITGENRGYRRDVKAFDRVTPIENFFRVSTADGVCMGKGAWEMKARYSWLDMNAGQATAGFVRGYQNGFTTGANWYWNPYTRMMFDYVYEDVDLITGVTGSTNNFGIRFQIDY